MVPMSDATGRSPNEDAHMAQQLDHRRRATAEEREFLEQLVFLRGLYAERGPRDRASVASIGSTIVDAERRLRAVGLGASA
jgi:hypothetical protein